ncbi:hypothetical protein IWW40_005869, partial [Coemansia sp. RSA 1250]
QPSGSFGFCGGQSGLAATCKGGPHGKATVALCEWCLLAMRLLSGQRLAGAFGGPDWRLGMCRLANARAELLLAAPGGGIAGGGGSLHPVTCASGSVAIAVSIWLPVRGASF